MRRARRLLVLAAVLLAFLVPSLASASSTVPIPTRDLTAKGGTVKWVVTLPVAKTCTWSSSPKVAGFHATVKCKAGKVSRLAKFHANISTKKKDYTLSLTARGETTAVYRLKVLEAAETTATATTTVTPPTTTSVPSLNTTTTTTLPSSTTTTTTPPASSADKAGEIYAWGDDASGLLGNGSDTPLTAPTWVTLPGGMSATQIAVGQDLGLAIGSDGNAYDWGEDQCGALGDGGDSDDISAPEQVALPAGVTAVGIAAGGAGGYVVGSDGSVYGWGDNGNGELGDGSSAECSLWPVPNSPTRRNSSHGGRCRSVLRDRSRS